MIEADHGKMKQLVRPSPSNCCATSASIFPPFTAARATFGLNAGL
jgi:hypothetical protein